MPTGIPITEEVKKRVSDYYKNNIISIDKCANLFGLSSPTVIKILDEFGIVRHKKSKLYNPNMNENYFSIIDDEHKAYWVGFLITDGNVFVPKDKSNKQASISISQKENRSYLLEQFLKDIGSNTGISHDGRGTNMVAVRSNNMANDLAKYGIVENKTLKSYLPKINDSLMNHMIRGMLDGDGSVTSLTLKTNKHKHAISFCGTHELMQDIAEYVSKKLNVSKPSVYDYQDRHLSEIKWQSIEDCKTVGDWIYKEATIYISDKREKYQNFINHYNL